MTRSGSPAHATAFQAPGRVRDIIDNPSPQAEAAVRWAMSRLDEANVPDVVHGVVATLTGNARIANQARKAASKAVRRVERNFRPANRGGRKFLLAIGLLAASAATWFLLWRAVASHAEPKVSEDLGGPVDANGVNSAN